MRELKPRKTPDGKRAELKEQRVLAIVKAARNVLIEDGYRGLTMRAVADASGISVGHVTYHFPRRLDLLEELFERVFDEYLVEFERIRAEAGDDPRVELEEIVRFIFADLRTQETTVFFPEIWALANHEPAAAKFVDQIYVTERAAFAEIIGRIHPRLSDSRIAILALYLSATVEGHTMFVGHRKSFARRRKEAEELVVAGILATVDRVAAETQTST